MDQRGTDNVNLKKKKECRKLEKRLRAQLETHTEKRQVGVGIIYRNYRKALEGRLRNSVLI